MNSKRAFEIEKELLEECEDYISHGSEPKDDIMEACVKAYIAVFDYRKEMEKEEARRAGTPGEPLK